MPKIYEYIGFVFFFYSNDHPPIHCHVMKGDKEVKVEMFFKGDKLDYVTITNANSHTEELSGKDLDLIKVFVEAKYIDIKQKWEDFRAGKKIQFEKINKELK